MKLLELMINAYQKTSSMERDEALSSSRKKIIKFLLEWNETKEADEFNRPTAYYLKNKYKKLQIK